jgi:hypothetical protein
VGLAAKSTDARNSSRGLLAQCRPDRTGLALRAPDEAGGHFLQPTVQEGLGGAFDAAVMPHRAPVIYVS